MRYHRDKSKVFSRRALVTGIFKTALISTLVARFGYLQLVSGSKYRTMAENNSIKIVILAPLRGLLLDRNDIVIADNQLNCSLILDSRYKHNAQEIIKYIEKILGYQTHMSKIGIKKALWAAGKNNHIIIQDNLEWVDIAKIEVRTDLQGVNIIKGEKRVYPFNEAIAHITGYISKPNAQEVEESTIPHYQNFLIGKNGIEKSLNDGLLGNPGARKIEVNASGKFIRELLNLPPSKGTNAALSIDMDLQKIVAKNLQSLNGSAVVMDAHTGEILAMHSTPSYDPNQFVSGVRSHYWDKLRFDKGKPLINKSISTPYPPGSIFKIATALAILKAGVDTKKKIFCTGEHYVGNRKFRCWKEGGHGWVDFNLAIAKSCNIYFYIFGLIAGLQNIMEVSHELGFGLKTGVELPFENAGFVPSHSWIKNRLKGNWGPGHTANTTIGQGYLLTTPIQLATAAARVATGNAIKPTLQKDQSLAYNQLQIPQLHLNLVRQGLYDVFNSHEGTGYSKKIDEKGFALYGKTGTAQVTSQSKRNQVLQYQNRDHGLFAGYLAHEKKIYAISVVAEHAGWGSISALPIGISIIKEYFGINKQIINEKIDEENDE